MVFMVQEWDLLVKVANIALITCGPDRRLDLDLIKNNYGFYGVKVDLGPKVGSDREKPWFLWSRSC